MKPTSQFILETRLKVLKENSFYTGSQGLGEKAQTPDRKQTELRFLFGDGVSLLLPRLEFNGAISAHRNLRLLVQAILLPQPPE